MAEYKQDQSSEESVVVNDTAGSFKKRRCRYCQREWTPGRSESHRPGCPNTPRSR